jgi:hypothetical protein
MLKFTHRATFLLLALLSMTFVGLWIRSFYWFDAGMGPSYLWSDRELGVFSRVGILEIGLADVGMTTPRSRWSFSSHRISQQEEEFFAKHPQKWYFRAVDPTEWGLSCPTWFPGAITGLLAIAVLRFNRRFSVRSTMFATTAIAILLGMIVVSMQGEK